MFKAIERSNFLTTLEASNHYYIHNIVDTLIMKSIKCNFSFKKGRNN